jgi:hypothetical protein
LAVLLAHISNSLQQQGFQGVASTHRGSWPGLPGASLTAWSFSLKFAVETAEELVFLEASLTEGVA